MRASLACDGCARCSNWRHTFVLFDKRLQPVCDTGVDLAECKRAAVMESEPRPAMEHECKIAMEREHERAAIVVVARPRGGRSC